MKKTIRKTRKGVRIRSHKGGRIKVSIEANEPTRTLFDDLREQLRLLLGAGRLSRNDLFEVMVGFAQANWDDFVDFAKKQ